MEEDNDMEQVTGSPTAGENEFVHVESVDSAPTDDSTSIHQVEHLEQDDGVVITGVDAVQDEPHDVRTHEDAGPDEFVDCPDDLVSNEARSPGSAIMPHQQPFRDDTVDIIKRVFDNEKEIIPLDYEEERRVLMKKVSNLHHQLKALSNQQSLVDENNAGDSTLGIAEVGEKSNLPLLEMVNECSKFVEFSANERLQSEGTIRELYATLNMKDKEIEDLMIRANDQSKLQDLSSFEVVVDRILSSIVIAFGGTELPDTSVSGKLSYLEENTDYLLKNYNFFLCEVQMLAQCLVHVKPDFQMETYMQTIFPTVREELVELKRKELEFNEKNTALEYKHGQLMEQLEKNRETIELLNAELEKLKGEVEQEKTRYTNTKEKLSMAVTKGKALVQQRDSLKQLVAEKTSELERCLVELQEKSTALEAAELRIGELTQTEILTNSLQEALTQRDVVLEKFSQLFQGLPEVAQFPNLEYQLNWLLESYNLAKDQSIKLHDENNAMKESASAQIDHLTASLLAETQEKYNLKEQLEEFARKYEEIVEEKKQMAATPELSPMDIEVFEKIQSLLYVSNLESKIYEHEIVKVSEELHASKDELNSLQINLQRSEEKSSLLREKLSMAVKKGKGLVQERENMKQQMAEKNAQIEALTVDFQKQESALSDYKDQVAKLDSERNQIGQFLAQSNMMLQNIVEIIDGIDITFPLELKEPVEKLKWLATYLSECQVAKAQAEHELGDVKDEAGQLASKLTEVLVNVKSLEDALSVSEKNVYQLSEMKRELEDSKVQAEQEVEILKVEIDTLNNKLVETLKTLKSLEDKLAGTEKTISLLTEEKSELESAKCHAEEELHKARDEITSQTSKFQEALSNAENNISKLTAEKEAAQMEVQKVKEDVSFHASNLGDAKKTIKSLEDAIFQLNTNVSQFSQENEKAVDNRTVLESEIKKLREEAEHEISTLKTELTTCRHELAVVNDKWGPQLLGFLGKFQVLLKDESLFSLFKKSFETKIESLKEIDQLLKDMKDSFDKEQLQDHPAIEKNFQSPTFFPDDLNYDWTTGMVDDDFNAEDTEGIGAYVGKTFDNLNTKNQMLANQFGNFSALIDDIIASLLKKLEAIRNTIPFVVQQATSLQQKVENMQMDKEMQDNKVVTLENAMKVLVSACTDVTKDLNMLQADPTIGLEKSYPGLSVVDDVVVADAKVAADELLSAARNVQTVMEQLVGVKENMSSTIESLQAELKKTSSMYDKSKEVIEELKVELEKTSSMHDKSKEVIEELKIELEKTHSMHDKSKEVIEELKIELEKNSSMYANSKGVIEELQVKLEKTSSMYDKSKGVIEELQGELEKTGSMYEKVKDENDAFQKRVFKLETELEASRESCNEMSSRLEDYRAKEDKWNERERELSVQSISSVKDHEDDAVKALLSASQIKMLFEKVDDIAIPFPSLLAVGDKQAQDLNPVEKLFYIIDSVNDLLDQLTLLTHTKDDLQSTLSKQTLEVDHLKGEFRDGLQNIIQKLGGDESIGVKKPADVAGLLLVLERLVQGIVLDGQSSRSKLVETQKIAEELSNKVKLMEDSIQNRTSRPDTIQERGVIGSPSFSPGSEISEIDDQVTVGKAGLPLVPSAAQMRSLRKGSNEQLAITIDSESDRLLNKAETVEDKGHLFKSLHTTGLVPVQGKMIADRIDGIWVSGVQALMRRPRARLGLIAYWLVLHLWLLGTIL
ncbi:trans-Golgi network-localized SYP41-interacting protein 1-like [Bidens hawaiensis]|uniref:trans-Golgi network-localized SYP41-interacting protein 1-like n=1 Tax=Bidens hawaiensis TaxID=980011 RepID=UPI00404A1133